MRILFYIESFRSGGKERRLSELIKGLCELPGWEVGLVLDRNEIFYKEIHKLPVELFFAERRGLRKDPRVFWKLFKITGRYKPDILCVWGNMPAVYSIPAKLLRSIPLVNCQITDAPPEEHDRWINSRVTFRFSDKIIANSKAGLKAYHAPQDRSLVIYNGFDFSRIPKQINKHQIRERFGIQTQYVVGMAASFSPFKDYNTYIRTAREILKTRDDITFLCIGSGIHDSYISILNDHERKRILFTGPVHPIEPMLSVCDVGVLTSNARLHGEGISNSLLEFSALSIPFIATDCGGNREILNRSDSWNIIPDRDHKALQKKILYLVDNQEFRLSLGDEARQRVESCFGLKRMVDDFAAVFYGLKR